jgi:hypothetical protein
MKFNELDKILIFSLKETVKKAPMSQLKLVLGDLKTARTKLKTTGTTRDIEFNAKNISIISKEINSRK